MIDASPFSSLDHATSFARQLWFKKSRIQSWLDAFSRHRHLTRAIGYASATIMKRFRLIMLKFYKLFQWDRRYIAKFGFEFTTSTDTWFSQKILDEVKVNIHAHYQNTLVVELEIAAREEFKLIEHGLERLWRRLSRSDIQEASEELGEVVPDSMEKEDVVSFDSSDEVESAGGKASMLLYDLNKTPEENKYPYSGMSPEKKNAWHLAMWAQRYLQP
ncbi:hypothetical protein Ahy_B07g086227 [Arachis hypogaea]|uniref:Oxo-4-hydroxy-4-carboxy-5-ureidoimidazoline decarboxylase domain-containing protein n=1 Tax=Arachis hypogaea TaxID=3818 RepID=A0A444Y9G8_ARAHY|nr:hypothetical protein Ahy_B07g086227 [Arachis hypogaea]